MLCTVSLLDTSRPTIVYQNGGHVFTFVNISFLEYSVDVVAVISKPIYSKPLRNCWNFILSATQFEIE